MPIAQPRPVVLIGLVVAALMIMLLLRPSEHPHAHESKSSVQHGTKSPELAHLHSDYRQAHGRSPPSNYNKWLMFAQEKGCRTHTSAYQQLYEDLGFFHEKGISDPASREAFVEAHSWMQMWSITTDGSVVGAVPHNPGIERILKDVTHLLLPRKAPLHLAVSDSDHPTLVHVPDVDGQLWEAPFTDLPCFKRTFGSARPADPTLAFIANGKSIMSQHAWFMERKNIISTNPPIPVISQSKLHCFNDILIPMNYHINSTLADLTDKVSWEEKKPVLFWRGATTGGGFTTTTPWRKFGRARALEWEKKWRTAHPDRVFDAGAEEPPSLSNWTVDIGLSNIVQSDQETEATIMQEYGLKKFVTSQKTMDFKYLLVLDGNGWPSRLQSYLHSNSVILYNGIFRDFFNWQLEPFVHYVPVRLDLSDLEERLQWLMDHEDEARQINENAKFLSRQVNRVENLQCYMGLFLLEYARLHDA
ncbi:glycosyl transferase family 90-domain-containing protein [Chytriomyces sp. MP71]|nr:glycosyl transferase family 90-domain-containing protein [Chytriomyces sp. MP71]